MTGENRRASALSRSIERYSASVVAPTMRSSPRASIGLSMLAASIAPSACPAPRIVWSSSTKRTIPPSASLTSSSDLLQALLELAAVLRPGEQAAEVERHDADAVQGLRHVALGHAQREAFDDRGLAHTGFTDQDGVVLAAAGEDLDGLLDLLGTTDDRVDAALTGVVGQVAAELVERGCLGRGLLRAPGARGDAGVRGAQLGGVRLAQVDLARRAVGHDPHPDSGGIAADVAENLSHDD